MGQLDAHSIYGARSGLRTQQPKREVIAAAQALAPRAAEAELAEMESLDREIAELQAQERARAAEAATAGAGGRALAWWQAPQYVLGALLAMIIAAIVYRIISYPGIES